MKNILLLVTMLLCSSLRAVEVKVRIVDDLGNPVSGATAVVEYVAPRQEQSATHTGMTDLDGLFLSRGVPLIEVYVGARKQGHYEARIYGLSPKMDHHQQVVLPRILKPIPLFAWDSRIGRSVEGLRFPVPDVWIGMDFEAADWVAPYGKGKVTDIQFRFHHEFLGWKLTDEQLTHSRKVNSRLTEREFKELYGKWDAELDIGFPGEKAGIIEASRFLSYSRLKLPHNAPSDGYLPAGRYSAKSYAPRTARENVGFFLRTRVKLDEGGNIVSANYAKIVGDFQLDARGFVTFAYYFNPVANDPNLEFDPLRNLFPSGFPGSNVVEP
jgi:hypothetical protein